VEDFLLFAVSNHCGTRLLESTALEKRTVSKNVKGIIKERKVFYKF